MDKNSKRKELKEQYRQTRSQMGVFAFRCQAAGRVYLGASQNMPSALTSIRFQLQNNSFPSNRRLLADWQQYGAAGFSQEALEVLDYDKDDDLKTDYLQDLAILKEFWRERLQAEGLTVENVKPRDR